MRWMRSCYTVWNGRISLLMEPFLVVTLLPAYKGNNSVGCAAYFGIENIVIPAVERLLDQEAGRTAVVAHWRIFLAFTVEVWVNCQGTGQFVCARTSLCVFLRRAVCGDSPFMQFCFYLWWTEVIDSLTMAVVQWSRKFWRKLWGILLRTIFKSYWIWIAFTLELVLDYFLCEKFRKAEICWPVLDPLYGSARFSDWFTGVRVEI